MRIAMALLEAPLFSVHATLMFICGVGDFIHVRRSSRTVIKRILTKSCRKCKRAITYGTMVPDDSESLVRLWRSDWARDINDQVAALSLKPASIRELEDPH